MSFLITLLYLYMIYQGLRFILRLWIHRLPPQHPIRLWYTLFKSVRNHSHAQQTASQTGASTQNTAQKSTAHHPQAETMVPCAVCHVYIPQSQAKRKAQGYVCHQHA